eukprot:gene25749-biopygen24011
MGMPLDFRSRVLPDPPVPPLGGGGRGGGRRSDGRFARQILLTSGARGAVVGGGCRRLALMEVMHVATCTGWDDMGVMYLQGHHQGVVMDDFMGDSRQVAEPQHGRRPRVPAPRRPRRCRHRRLLRGWPQGMWQPEKVENAREPGVRDLGVILQKNPGAFGALGNMFRGKFSGFRPHGREPGRDKIIHPSSE